MLLYEINVIIYFKCDKTETEHIINGRKKISVHAVVEKNKLTFGLNTKDGGY